MRRLNEEAVRPSGQYVLYWMQMNRRAEGNHALEHAVAEANRLGLPVLVYESVTCTYPYASDRFHTFLLEGVPDTQRRLEQRGIGYAFYLRRRKADANDVLYRLAAEAALCVTDDYPTFVATRHNASVPGKIGIPYLAVDSSCIVPMQLHQKKEYGAYTIRPKIKKMLADFLRPVERVEVERRWSGAEWGRGGGASMGNDAGGSGAGEGRGGAGAGAGRSGVGAGGARGCRPEWHVEVTAENIGELVASCEIDHSLGASLSFRGGYGEARRHLDHFLTNNLKRYDTGRNNPSDHATSNLSPYLHFGHISAHEVALGAQLAAFENGLDAEPFLEELIVRRELAFNHAVWAREVDSLDSIPNWARETLRKHAGDKREPCYTREEFERAATHDALWNATQKELLLRGKIHGYYRMYWGKKIIEWSAKAEDALETMVYLHDRYALDGRDPNTYTNILWCFGLHDRPWQERAVFGMVRYMSLEGMKRKTSVDAYLREIAHMELTGADAFRLK